MATKLKWPWLQYFIDSDSLKIYMASVELPHRREEMATVDNLVAKLKELGGSANNPDLKAALGVKDKDWDLIKKSALKAGVVVPGRGFGGRLVLADANLVPQPTNSHQKAPMASYDALAGKRLILMDMEGKPLSKPVKIGEIAVTIDMVVAVVE
jgi:hypothetical protein